jgi:hypothetical protein
MPGSQRVQYGARLQANNEIRSRISKSDTKRSPWNACVRRCTWHYSANVAYVRLHYRAGHSVMLCGMFLVECPVGGVQFELMELGWAEEEITRSPVQMHRRPRGVVCGEFEPGQNPSPFHLPASPFPGT